MAATKRMLCVVLALACLLPFFARPARAKDMAITDFRDIPNITGEEIAAIEALQARRTSFVYGMNLSTEAFSEEDGTIGGFTGLLCGWLSQLFGIPFEPALYGWEELTAGLQSGTIDFSGGIPYTVDPASPWIMTDVVAERAVKEFRLEGARDEGADGVVRYGFLEGSPIRARVSASSDSVFEAVAVADYGEAAKLLRQGAIDAFFEFGPAEAVFDAYRDIVAEDHFPLIYQSVSLATGNPELEPVIRAVQKYLAAGGLPELIELYNEGELQYLHHKLLGQLTDMEAAWLAKAVEAGEPIPAALEGANYPICFYNEREGAWQGMAVEILDRISLLTGLTFQAANSPDTPWQELEEMVYRGDAALVSQLIHTQERDGRFLWANQPYDTDSFVLLSLAGHSDLNVNQVLYTPVGIIEATPHGKAFQEWFPNHSDITVYPTALAGLDGLESGEIQLLMATRNNLLSATNYLERPAFKANITLEWEVDCAFGFNRSERLLRSVLSKAQALVDTRGIAEQWRGKVFDYRSKVARERLPILMVFSSLLVVALAVGLVFFLKNRRLSGHLEQLVRERTAELEVQTQAAQVASRAKSDFLARMSHEIRTPLNAITGMAHIARANTQNEKTRNSVDEIIRASGHLLGVLNDVLDMSKIEAGKFTLSEESFSLAGAMSEVETIVAQRCIEKGVSFFPSLRGLEGLTVRGDKLRLNQALINLLGNAAKFTEPPGGVFFTVRAEEPGQEAVSVSFTVRDEGIGMTGEQVANLFVPFEQADSSIATRFGGTGLGLAISQNLVGQMGGEIQVESEYGKGSVFAFTLSLPLSAEAPEATAADEGQALDLRGRRILLAEDIEVNRIIVKELLGDTGVTIEDAVDGDAVVEQFRASAPGQYDLIFMDIQMPKRTGYEAAAAIRAMDRPDARTIPILAMTANAYKEDIQRVMEAGMNGHLSKPIDIGQVRRTLAQYLPPLGDSHREGDADQ